MESPPVKSSLIMRGLGTIYGAGIAVRDLAYNAGVLRSRFVDKPVVCVGNVTLGGTGKTPFVRFMAADLLRLGKKPGILMRGYGGNYSGVKVVSASDTPAEVGDEACL